MPEETENYIRIPVKSAGAFTDSCGTITLKGIKGVKAIVCKQKEGGSAVRTYLFSKESWDMDRAKEWVAKHKDLEDAPTDLELITDLEDIRVLLKEESLEAVLNHVYQAWEERFGYNWGYIQHVYDDYVIAMTPDGYQKYNYSIDSNGKFEWEPGEDVEISWVKVKANTEKLTEWADEEKRYVLESVNAKLKGTPIWIMRIDRSAVHAVNLESGLPIVLPYIVDENGDIKLDPPVQEQEPEYEPVFGVKQDESGKWHWLSVSSDNNWDRSGERFSTKALQGSVEERTGWIREGKVSNYGPLRLCHHPAADVGICMTQRFINPYLIESGDFYDTPIAMKAAETLANDTEGRLGISIGYLYREKDLVDSVYRGGVRVFERSVTPRPANRRTAIAAFSEESILEEVVKLDRKQLQTDLAAIIGDEMAAKVLEEGDEKLRGLQTLLNIKFKEGSGEGTVTPGTPTQNTESQANQAAAGAPDKQDFSALKASLAKIKDEATFNDVVVGLKAAKAIPEGMELKFEVPAGDPVLTRIERLEAEFKALGEKPRDALYRPTQQDPDKEAAVGLKADERKAFFADMRGGKPVEVVGGPSNPSD